ncbi:hypothetical protein ACFQU7_02240 [Pseudoroseomonas wenyumeiae]
MSATPTTPRFHRLRIADLKRETRDAVSIAFDLPGSCATFMPLSRAST